MDVDNPKPGPSNADAENNVQSGPPPTDNQNALIDLESKKEALHNNVRNMMNQNNIK